MLKFNITKRIVSLFMAVLMALPQPIEKARFRIEIGLEFLMKVKITQGNLKTVEK